MAEASKPKLKDMINEMDSLMHEMQERMGSVLQRQKETFASAFKGVMIRVIDEFKALKEVLNEQAVKMQESDLVDKKLEFFRDECGMLGDMIQEYQKENKELKQRLLDLQQSMHCNEQALVNQGQKLLALKRRANSIAEARPQEPPTKRHLKLSPLNQRIAKLAVREQPFSISERSTQVNIYLLEKVAQEATEDILRLTDEPVKIQQLIKQLILDNVLAIKEQTVKTYEQYVLQLKQDIKNEMKQAKSDEKVKNAYMDAELRELFVNAAASLQEKNKMQIQKVVQSKNANLFESGRDKMEVICTMIADERFLRMLEHKIFGIECCHNPNCLYNYSAPLQQHYSPSTNVTPSLSNEDLLDNSWRQYGLHDPRSFQDQIQANFYKLRTLANPHLRSGLSKEEQLRNQNRIKETEMQFRQAVARMR